MITVITVPGIGEPLSHTLAPRGLLENFTRHLSPDLFICRQFNYRNQYGPVPTWDGTAYDVNLHTAVRELAGEVARDPNPVILAGYSAGAQVISQLLTSMHAGVHTNLEIPAVVMVANPLQRREEVPATSRTLFGIAGEHGPWPRDIQLFSLANPADIIPCSEEHSPLRGFSDITRTFSFHDPFRWIGKYLEAAFTGRNQNWWNPFTRGAWARAVDGGIGYLNRTQHEQWYLEGDRLKSLAASVNQFAQTRH